MQVVSTPNLEFFLHNDDEVEDYLFCPIFDDMRDKPFAILHTSGSTGIPKPVFITHGTFACNDAHQAIPLLGGNSTIIDFTRGKRLFLALPLFHAACLTFTLGFNVFSGMTCVIPPAGPLTAKVVDESFTYGRLDGALLPPSLIVDIYNNAEQLVNMCQRLKFLAYVGGTLPEEVGDSISPRLKLITLMGSCETALHPLELHDNPTDWQYMTFSPFMGHDFRLRPDRDGLQELIVVRQNKFDRFQGVFSTFPNLDMFPTNDLFEQHPSRPRSWVFRARADDIISFTNAEKLNPVSMEDVISTHPMVKSAIVGGQGKFQASLLIEPKVYPTTAEEETHLIQAIWPTIQQANRDCPAHGRIMRDFVMLSIPEKPIPRAAKDTVQRFAALKLYTKEFESLYERAKHQTNVNNATANKTVDTSYFVSKSDVRKASKKETILQDRAVRSSTEYRTPQLTALRSPKNYYSIAELDAQVEKTLHRLLPEALTQHLQSALGQMLINLLQPASVPAPTPIRANGLDQDQSNGRNQQNLNSEGSPHDENESLGRPFETAAKSAVEASPEDLRDFIKQAVFNNIYLHGLTDDSDLFECGLDSLLVPVLVNEINAFLIKSRPKIDLIAVSTVYDNPTINKLLKVLE